MRNLHSMLLTLAAALAGLTTGAQQIITVYTTAANTELRLTQSERLTFSPGRQPLETEPFVLVDPHASFQTILGFGGALTDASAETFARLSPDKQQELLTAYYPKL